MVLFGHVALTSPGFDDEITNIDLIEHLGTWQTVTLMQTEDVHPPGGYLVNGLLWQLTHDWSSVRLVSVLIYGLACASLLRFVQRQMGSLAAWLCLLVVGFSPTAMMWCTSVRWYAYLTPLLMWALVLPAHRAGWWFRFKPAMAWTLMAYISYASLVVAPGLWLWYALHAEDKRWTQRLRESVLPWGLAAMLFLPQAWVLLTVHAKNTAGQTGGLVKSLMGIVVSMASNQGLFPLSLPAAAAAIGWAMVLLVALTMARQQRTATSALAATGAGLLGFLASGLAGKFRNLVAMVPFQGLVLAQTAPWLRQSRALQLAVALIAVGQLVGSINVMRHQDTTKNSWNLPVNTVLQALDQATAQCQRPVAIYTFDAVLARAMRQHNPQWQVASYYSRFDKRPLQDTDCSVVLHTYRGALSTERHAGLLAAEAATTGQRGAMVQIGRDDNSALKRKLDAAYPEYQVSFQVIHEPGTLAPLNAWLRSAP